MALLQPTEFAQSVPAFQTTDVTTTGTIVQVAGTRECTDLIRVHEGEHSGVLLAPAAD